MLGASHDGVLGTGLLPLPAPLLMPILLIAGALAGAVLLLGPTLLKTRFGVDEVVTTLLLNFIILLFVCLLLEGPLKDPDGPGLAAIRKVIARRRCPRSLQGKRLHLGFVVAIVAALVVWFINTRTTLGYRDARGRPQRAAARFAGMPVDRGHG